MNPSIDGWMIGWMKRDTDLLSELFLRMAICDVDTAEQAACRILTWKLRLCTIKQK